VIVTISSFVFCTLRHTFRRVRKDSNHMAITVTTVQGVTEAP
jgi:hypothetical protein